MTLVRDWRQIKQQKWQRGRQKYGAVWAGKPPLVECLDELVDAGNYIDEACRRRQIARSTAWLLDLLLQILFALVSRLQWRG